MCINYFLIIYVAHNILIKLISVDDLITIFLLLVITFLSLYPLPELPEFSGTDKTHHLVAYFILVFPSGLRKPKKWGLFVFLFIIFGGVIEMIQPYVNRYGEWFDFFAKSNVRTH